MERSPDRMRVFTMRAVGLLSLPLLLSALAVAGCGSESASTSLTGSGVQRSEVRTPGAFTTLSVAKAADVYVTLGTPSRVSVTTDDNILPEVGTQVVGGELRVTLDRQMSTRLGVRVDVNAPALTSVKAGPAVKVHMTGATADRLVLDGQPASVITVSGKSAQLVLTLLGAARADLKALEVGDADVSLDGAATADVLATGSVTGNARGVSHVGVWGSPKVDVKTSGGSTVSMMGMP